MEYELKLPPMDIDAERRILGYLLSVPCSMQRMNRLSSTDFYRNDHRIIFAHIRKISGRGMRTDPKSIGASIKRTRESDKSGGSHYLNELSGVDGFSDSDVLVVTETARRRRLIVLCDDLCAALLAGNANPRFFVQMAREAMNYYWEFAMRVKRLPWQKGGGSTQ